MMIDINTTVIVEPVLQPNKVVLKRKVRKLTAEEIKKKKDDLEREEKECREKHEREYIPPTDEEIRKYEEEQEQIGICGRQDRYGEICNDKRLPHCEYCCSCMEEELRMIDYEY